MLATVAVLVGCSYDPLPASNGDDAPIDTSSDAPQDSVVADATVDTPPDVRSFDPATDCPIEYTISFPAVKSRYRAIGIDRTWPSHFTDCADDLAGATHLIVFDDATELTALGGQALPRFLVGHFQMPNQAAVETGWLGVTGGAADAALWLSGQPNDNDDAEDGEQDRSFINYNTGTGVQDGPVSFAAEAMCECDGMPIPPQVTLLLGG